MTQQSPPPVSLTPAEAALSCLTLTACIDGPMDEADALLIAEISATTRGLKKLSANKIASAQETAQAILGGADGFETLLEMIEASAPKRTLLYVLSAELIVRRGRVSPAEMRLLDILAERLRLPPLTRAAIDTATRIRFSALV